jgi:hypothetical protein
VIDTQRGGTATTLLAIVKTSRCVKLEATESYYPGMRLKKFIINPPSTGQELNYSLYGTCGL